QQDRQVVLFCGGTSSCCRQDKKAHRQGRGAEHEQPAFSVDAIVIGHGLIGSLHGPLSEMCSSSKFKTRAFLVAAPLPVCYAQPESFRHQPFPRTRRSEMRPSSYSLVVVALMRTASASADERLTL